MTAEIVLRYLHFVSIFAIVGTISMEHILLRKELTRREIARLSRIDAVYGLAALTLITVGMMMWFGGYSKPTVFYSKNWVFHTKIGLFFIVGLLSVYPTIFFIKKRKGNPEDVVAIPSSVFWLIRIELLILFVLPLFAGLMAHGVGFFG